MKASEFFKKVGVDAVRSYLAAYEDALTDELKRLVESHELIKEHGSIDRAKMYAESIYTAPEVVERLKQAILDVESCQ